MPNDTLATLLNHRSIRHFKDRRLTDDEVTQLVAAAQQAATSTFSQQYSIISVTDPTILAALATITTYPWVKRVGHYFIFLVDQARNAQLMAPLNPMETHNLTSPNKFLSGAMDVSIAIEAMATAAESMGLGGTIMASILNDTQQLVDLLHLPPLTFPLLGYAVGEPAAPLPDVKPRLPQSLMHFTNTYQSFAADNPVMTAYDQQIFEYYTGRNLSLSFIDHLVREFSRDPEGRDTILPVIKAQGFDF